MNENKSNQPDRKPLTRREFILVVSSFFAGATGAILANKFELLNSFLSYIKSLSKAFDKIEDTSYLDDILQSEIFNSEHSIQISQTSDQEATKLKEYLLSLNETEYGDPNEFWLDEEQINTKQEIVEVSVDIKKPENQTESLILLSFTPQHLQTSNQSTLIYTLVPEKILSYEGQNPDEVKTTYSLHAVQPQGASSVATKESQTTLTAIQLLSEFAEDFELTNIKIIISAFLIDDPSKTVSLLDLNFPYTIVPSTSEKTEPNNSATTRLFQITDPKGTVRFYTINSITNISDDSNQPRRQDPNLSVDNS